PAVPDHYTGNVAFPARPLDQERGRTRRAPLRQETVRIRARPGPGPEQHAGLDAPAVIGDTGQPHVALGRRRREQARRVQPGHDLREPDRARGTQRRPPRAVSTRTTLPRATTASAAGHVDTTLPAPSICTRRPAPCSARTA